MSTIKLKGIYKKFDDTEVLHDINLEVEEGEFDIEAIERELIKKQDLL